MTAYQAAPRESRKLGGAPTPVLFGKRRIYCPRGMPEALARFHQLPMFSLGEANDSKLVDRQAGIVTQLLFQLQSAVAAFSSSQRNTEEHLPRRAHRLAQLPL